MMESTKGTESKTAVEPKPSVQKQKSKSKKKTKKTPSDPTAPRKSFLYSARHDDLDLYGVIVEWDERNLTHNRILRMFETALSSLRTPADSPKQSVKSKPKPYFRRTGRAKGIVTFHSWSEANTFSSGEHTDFRAFIPMSFVITIGVVYFNAPKINFKEAFASCLDKFEIIQWRIKRVEPNKVRVTFAVCGTELPKSILFHDKNHPVERYVRHPVRCNRCLRYGHRTGSCFRRARCGTCALDNAISWHAEKVCRVIRNDRGAIRCMYCNDGHATGSEACGEEKYQRSYKAQLVKHNMNYAKTLVQEIIPMVRSTSINSNRIWLD